MIKFNMRDFERAAHNIGEIGKQLPFAASLALNRGAEAARSTIINETWPSAVKVKNQSFMNATLRIERAKAADFRQNGAMSVRLYDRFYERVSLTRLEKGGLKTPKRRSHLAIPTPRVRRGSNGAVVKSQRPANLKRKVVKGGLIFQAEGRGKNSKLRLFYKLQTSVRVPAKVPFHAAFEKTMRVAIRDEFPRAVRDVLQRNLGKR